MKSWPQWKTLQEHVPHRPIQFVDLAAERGRVLAQAFDEAAAIFASKQATYERFLTILDHPMRVQYDQTVDFVHRYSIGEQINHQNATTYKEHVRLGVDLAAFTHRAVCVDYLNGGELLLGQIGEGISKFGD